MAVRHAEIGLVTTDDALVSFYRDVFEVAQLEPRVLPTGTVHRLGPDPAILKILVVADAHVDPAPPPEEFWTQVGLRYFTLWVDDLEATGRRATSAGGIITLGPINLRAGVRTMVLRDPDGNLMEVMEQRQ